MDLIALGYGDLAAGSLLVIANAALSLWLRLGLERRIVVAMVRMVVQLSLIGLVLKALFALVSPTWTGVAALVMVLFAGREIIARQHRRLSGWWAYGLGTSSMTMAALVVAVLALTVQVRPEPWYDPRYALPLLGMILGNTMTGISLGLDTLMTAVVRERPAIEARIALGADRWTALHAPVRDALRNGLIPIVNAMAAAGIVSLPGMMTGQILAGVVPTEAIKYQILIMFLIAGATGLGTLAAVFSGAWRVTDARHRLRLDRVVEPQG